jgi:L-lactate dehydrogenase complex protein LldE
MFNAGLRADARKVAEHTLRVFEEAEGDIVMPSGSCAHMLRHNYVELFRGDAARKARAEQLASRTYELTEYLVDVLGVTDCQARWDGPIAYHPTCHLHRGLQVDRAPRLLLEHVRGVEMIDLPEAEDCCGFGGVFSVEHPELATELLGRKIRNLDATGASTLVVCDTGCLMHLQGGLRRSGSHQKVVHIAEVLDSTSSLREHAAVWRSHDRE